MAQLKTTMTVITVNRIKPRACSRCFRLLAC